MFAVLDRLAQGDVLVARPRCEYDSRGASALVRSYYRVRNRGGFVQHKLVMWGAGAYGLNEKGHERFGSFPAVTGDDLYVDTRFDAHEKAVVATDPSVIRTPADVRSLVAILGRHRGGAELLASEAESPIGSSITSSGMTVLDAPCAVSTNKSARPNAPLTGTPRSNATGSTE